MFCEVYPAWSLKEEEPSALADESRARPWRRFFADIGVIFMTKPDAFRGFG
jgi:hypothetical protein